MKQRIGAFGTASALLASAFIAVATLGMSAAHADSFEDWANVSAGDSHTCGVRENGKLYCWGYDGFGQIGDGGTNTDVNAPERIGTFEDWATVAAGGNHTCGVRKNGKLYCWGNDGSGQVGDGTDDNPNLTPQRIGTFEDWADVATGGQHTCGVRKNGKLYCWGYDDNGQIGDGGGDNVLAPRRVGTFEDWSTVAAGAYHSCGTRHGGKLYCWGDDFYGQVGDGGPNTDATAPARIGTFDDWANVDGGDSHTCGVRENGKLYCWGGDGNGQLGDGDTPGPVIAPRRIGTFEDWANVSAGYAHTCGVRTNGKLYCWGSNGFSRLGDGGTSPATAPRRIGTFEDWANAAAGGAHTCGIRHGGKLYCWGFDDNGQVGDGDNPNPATTPRRI